MAERLAMVREIACRPGWITEGGHLGWTEPLFSAADVIIWLDPSLCVLLARHWARHRHRGLWWLARYGWGWQIRWYFQAYRHDLAPDRDTTINRRATALALEPWEGKTRRYRAALDADGLEQLLRDIRP